MVVVRSSRGTHTMDDLTDILDVLITEDDTEVEIAQKYAEYHGELRPATAEEMDKYERLFLTDREGKKFGAGGRHKQLVNFGIKLWRVGNTDAVIKQKLGYFDDNYNDPPKKNPGEINEIVKWLHENIPQGLPVVKHRTPESLENTLTDVGNARRMLNAHGKDVLYDAISKMWMIWNQSEGKWEIDEKEKIKEMVKDVILKIKIEAEDLYAQSEQILSEEPKNENEAKSREKAAKDLKKRADGLYKWWMSCQFSIRMEGCLKVLRTYNGISVSPNDFNKNKYFFNCKNGTLDLTTMTLRPHNRDDRITMSSGVVYNKDAKCPEFDAFMERIFKNHEEKEQLKTFTQRAYGSCLSGDTSLQKIFMPTGPGGNGKTVEAKIMLSVAGDYGKTIAASSLTTKMEGRVRDDLAYLVGVRMAIATEVAPDSVLNEEIVKQLAGGDEIVCRHLYGKPFPLKPELKLFWSFNTPPSTNDMSKGLWDRIRMIPHEESIRGTSEDIEMGTLLQKYEKEKSGILNWLIEGYIQLKARGLPECNAVKLRTQEYKEDSDKLQGFFEDEIDETWPLAKTTVASVWNAYLWYCREKHERYPMSHRTFGIKVKDRIGAKNCARDESARYYLGIRPKRSLPDFNDFFNNDRNDRRMTDK